MNTKDTDIDGQITRLAWEFINKDILNYESNPEINIIDSKITRLELIETFDTLADAPIDVYALEYRLLLEDLSKVVLAGGMDVDEEGGLKKRVAWEDLSLELNNKGKEVNKSGKMHLYSRFTLRIIHRNDDDWIAKIDTITDAGNFESSEKGAYKVSKWKNNVDKYRNEE